MRPCGDSLVCKSVGVHVLFTSNVSKIDPHTHVVATALYKILNFGMKSLQDSILDTVLAPTLTDDHLRITANVQDLKVDAECPGQTL